MRYFSIITALLAAAPAIVVGSVTFDIYLGADQPGDCTGEEFGKVTQSANGVGGPEAFENAACIQVESPDACCTAVLYQHSNCTQIVGSLDGEIRASVLQVDFGCVQVSCGNVSATGPG
ncbi:hypothetical protein LTR91_003017 [Friedmanniomyces endolithicus]|uniref:Hydrophobin n=1 Tax=Friedmanniomyces endolithicus TaxID=329885 RepID=A0A4U0UXV5_9PEZI|nr:hypothetical protein LTS09_012901 [Friedmanniomyces endolithicus]KAK0287563.1 hypothetical protein LTR35_004038 [Friedmanniomyces endolithicus]KAK0300142.1 hypothetical protein LTS00_001214 [Friedmanniomyces endolithicus]KAK0314647.1 hypothetical protein LTR01_001471 [Friedmanniomyces endolithicus]KAK0325054.1 hypothetical protein LTR82_004040 [Friedmanniomyces endolithicus]